MERDETIERNPPPPEVRPAASQSTKRRFHPRMLIWPAIAAFVLIGWLADRGTTHHNLLEPGDCFMMPEGVEEFERLDTESCSAPHDSQIIAKVSVEGPASYPDEDDPYWGRVYEACWAEADARFVRFEELPRDMYIDFFTPVAETWRVRNQDSLCFITAPGGLEGSFVAGS